MRLTNMDKPVLGVSACLLGESVRYDGRHKYDQHVHDLLNEAFALRPFCPEVGIGLSVPRVPMQLSSGKDELHTIGVEEPVEDVARELYAYGEKVATEARDLSGFVLKSRSPSCGLYDVKILQESGEITDNGKGLFSQALQDTCPGMPVIDEQQLHDVQHAEAFILQARIYHHWRSTQSAVDVEVDEI